MAAPKVVASHCPTCGASLPVPPGALQVTCRYCQHVIHVEHRKPPPEVRPFGAPGAIPSQTLYLDPAAADAAAKAGKGLGCLIAGMALLPIVIIFAASAGPWAFRSCKNAIKPFPVACGMNEEITVSGNYETTGPLITSVATNCKVHIKNAKLKGGTLLKSDVYNLELSLDNVTIETTDPMIHSGGSLKLKVDNSTLTSTAAVIEGESNLQIDLTGSTLESKQGVGVKTKSNPKVKLENAKIRGKKAGLDTDSNLVLTMKKGSEITSSDGPAVKTTSSLKLEADGGKIDGGLVVSSGADIEATGLTFTAKEKAIASTSSLKLELTDGSITSSGDVAIDTDSSAQLTFVNTKVQGATTGINCESSAKIKATKKSMIVGLQAYGILTTSNTELSLADSGVDGRTKAFKATVNDKLRLSAGALLSGKKGGIEAEGNLDLESTGATIDGGSGPGIQATYNARISMKQGTLKGAPAILLERRPTGVELEGTRVEGEQKIPTR